MNLRWTNIGAALVEQVEQRQTWTREDLDQMSCVYICQEALVVSLVPKYGTKHSIFTGMNVSTVGIERLGGELSKMTVNYVGKFSISGNQLYISPTRIDSNWTEGEVSYTQSFITGVMTTAGLIYSSYKANVSRRYTGMGCSIRYVTNQRPTTGLFASLATPYLGFTNIVTVQTGVQILGTGTPDGQLSSQAQPTLSITLVDLAVTDLFGWYQVVETYASKMFPGAVPADSPGSTSTSHLHGDDS